MTSIAEAEIRSFEISFNRNDHARLDVTITTAVEVQLFNKHIHSNNFKSLVFANKCVQYSGVTLNI